MNDTKNGQPDDAELSLPESLLPWYATGHLSAEDRAQVESALAGDEELRRRLALVRDESAETIALNESLRTPPVAAMDRLMAKIDLYEAEHPRRVSISERAFGFVSGMLSGLTPRTLAWSAMAAAVVICLQAGLLTGLLVDRHEGAHFKTASLETGAENKGTYALVAFVGALPLQEMTAFLLDHHVSLLEGPKPGGLYRVKLADEKLSAEALNAKLVELRAQTNVVSLIVPEAGTP
jgi:hypothetical protein